MNTNQLNLGPLNQQADYSFINISLTSFWCQVIQATVQVIMWYHIFKYIKSYCHTHYSSSSWYKQAISKGDGEEEFLMILCAIPQHTLSAAWIYAGIYFNSPSVFSIGTLGEFSFEFIELYNILMAKYYYNNTKLKDSMIMSMIFHHLPGIIVIIPINVYYSSNLLIQQISFSLLVIAPLGCIFFVLFKTRNVYDLQQRGQFTVYYFITIMLMIYFRFYYTPYYMIQFLSNDFFKFNTFSQIMFVFYAALINLFNITFVIILSQRLYNFLYGNKCTKKKQSNLSKLNLPSPPKLISLKRCRSSPSYYKLD